MSENTYSQGHQPAPVGFGAHQQEQEKMVVPRTVRSAFTAICVLGVIYLVSQIYGLVVAGQLQSMQGNAEALGSQAMLITNIMGGVFALGIAALYFVVAWFVKNGANWARILAIVLSALSLVTSVFSLLMMPLLKGFLEGIAESMPASESQSIEETFALALNPFSIATSVISIVLYIFVIVMLSLKPSGEYYRAVRDRKMHQLRSAHQVMYGAPAGYAPAYPGGAPAQQQAFGQQAPAHPATAPHQAAPHQPMPNQSAQVYQPPVSPGYGQHYQAPNAPVQTPQTQAQIQSQDGSQSQAQQGKEPGKYSAPGDSAF